MKIIVFGASNSKASINKQFATHTANQFEGNEIEVLDLNDYPLPIYSADIEKESGIPTKVIDFDEKLLGADLIIISLAEHNGSYSAVFKNLFDWLSRYRMKVFEDKKLILLATSPGGRGGQTVLETALGSFPRFGAKILGHFSLSKFYENFDSSQGIINEELKKSYTNFIEKMKSILA